MARSIQFRDQEELLTAFKNTKAEGWSIWEGKQFLTKGTGSDMLDTFLDSLSEGTTNTVYTLRIYEDITDRAQIKEKTEADGSFNFILSGDPETISPLIYAEKNRKNRLFERLGAIEEKLEAITGGEPLEEKPQTIGSVAMDLLKNPSQLLELVQVWNALTGKAPVQNQVFRPAAIGNIAQTATGTAATETISEDQRIQRCQSAITILDNNDPKLMQHLEKLARLSQSDPAQWKFLINLLDNM